MMQTIIALNQLVNTLVYIRGDGWGMADECFSARSFRLLLQDIATWPCSLVNTLFFWQPNHCYHAWVSEFERQHQPTHYRGNRYDYQAGAG